MMICCNVSYAVSLVIVLWMWMCTLNDEDFVLQ